MNQAWRQSATAVFHSIAISPLADGYAPHSGPPEVVTHHAPVARRYAGTTAGAAPKALYWSITMIFLPADWAALRSASMSVKQPE